MFVGPAAEILGLGRQGRRTHQTLEEEVDAYLSCDTIDVTDSLTFYQVSIFAKF